MSKNTLLLLGLGAAYLYLTKSASASGFKPAPCYPLNFVGPLPPGGFTCPTSIGPGGGTDPATGTTWISCDQPGADPVMCANLRAMQQ